MASTDDVTEVAAAIAKKPADHYFVQEFQNEEGGYSAALVDGETGSICLQANSASAGDARKRLVEAVEAGNTVKLDGVILPKVPKGTDPRVHRMIRYGYEVLRDGFDPATALL